MATVRPGGAAGVCRSVFISYTTHSAADLEARERLCEILVPMCRARTMKGDPWQVWVDDRCLNAGDDWNDRLTDALHDASLFVVVMSKKYLMSPFCMDTELVIMLERHVDEGVPVLGVWLDNVKRDRFVATLAGGRVMSLDERQCLPRSPEGAGLLAVHDWTKPDNAWAKVDEEIERAWPVPAPLSNAAVRAARPRSAAVVSPQARFAPFLCDRRDPADAVLEALEGWSRRPLLIVAEGRRDDCLAEWAERIAQHDLVTARPEFDRSEVQFPDAVVLEWPAGAVQPRKAWERDLVRRYTGFTASGLDALHLAQARAPAFWVTELSTDLEMKDALAVLDGLVSLLADWPDRAARAMLVVAVHLVRPEGDKPSRLAKAFERRLAGVAQAGRVHAVWVGALPVVRETDLRPWLRREAVRPHLPVHEVERLVPRLGFQPNTTMPMRAFADQVHRWLDNPDSIDC
jgi:hypothetical protein